MDKVNLSAEVAAVMRELDWTQGVFADRLNKFIKQNKIAGAANVSQQNINNLLNRPNLRPRYAPELTLFLQALRAGHIDVEHGFSGVEQVVNMSHGNKVPLISWTPAGGWEETFDPYAPGEAEAWYECPGPHGKGTFVLRVRGLSMWKPDGTGYADGSLIFCDPSRPLQHGKDIIARLPERDLTTFKRYQDDGERKYLLALNPEWPPAERIIPLTEKAYCKAVVIGNYIER